MSNLKNILDSNLIDRTGIVYKITNKVNGKIYIGKTVNSFRTRYFGRFGTSKVFITHNDNLQLDLYEYGLNNFDVELLVTNLFDEELLLEIENIYIKEYQEKFEMYNKDFNRNRNINSNNIIIKKSIIDLFLNLDIERNYKVRLLKLCTYMNHKNVLVIGEKRGQRKMREMDLEEILNLGYKETKRTKDYLLENNLIFIDEYGVITINLVINYLDLKESKYLINYLYDNFTSKEHKMFSILLDILKYYNFEQGVLCENVLDDNLKVLKFSKVTKAIGLNTSTSKGYKRRFLKLKINNDNSEMY